MFGHAKTIKFSSYLQLVIFVGQVGQSLQILELGDEYTKCAELDGINKARWLGRAGAVAIGRIYGAVVQQEQPSRGGLIN